MGILNYLTEEQAMERNNDIAEWQSKQPKFIAVKMLNIEIVDAIKLEGVIKDLGNSQIVAWVMYKDQYTTINGELYQKQLNPKNYDMRHEPVIPWES